MTEASGVKSVQEPTRVNVVKSMKQLFHYKRSLLIPLMSTLLLYKCTRNYPRL